MAMRVSGINSGLDTDSIVQELVSAYNTKTEKYQKEQTKLSWKQEIWKGLNTKVYSLYNNVGKLRFSSAYSTKKTTSSDTTKATVSASSNAVNGTQKLHVLATAQSGYLTGGKLSLREEVTDADGTTKLQDVKGAVKAETKLSELGFTGDEASLNINTTDEDGNAVTKTVSLTKDSTIQDVVNALKDNGLNASFDANNGRIFVSSKNTGKAADFSLSSATESCLPVVPVLFLLRLSLSFFSLDDTGDTDLPQLPEFPLPGFFPAAHPSVCPAPRLMPAPASFYLPDYADKSDVPKVFAELRHSAIL